MSTHTGLRMLVAKQALRRTRLAPDPHAPATRALADGELRLAVDHFALTANNITYAAFGEAMKYWQFFPCEDAAWGCIPVWGFAEVDESRVSDIAVGARVYGYLPMGSHLVVRPGRVNARGFVDTSAHRQELASVYNQYTLCAGDASYNPEREAQQAILRPLFTTSFLIDDFLAEEDFFGARQLVLSSASSKTAYGTAFCLAQRRGTASAVHVVGLTSSANLEFTRSLGCYDEVRSYDEMAALPPEVATVFVDFAGNTAQRAALHQHFDGQLRYSCSVGATHWEGLGGGKGLLGPKPVLFFAPAQVKKRAAAPPLGWGPMGLQERLDVAWQAFMQSVCDAHAPWLEVQTATGADAVEAALHRLLEGHADPRHGLMLRL